MISKIIDTFTTDGTLRISYCTLCIPFLLPRRHVWWCVLQLARRTSNNENFLAMICTFDQFRQPWKYTSVALPIYWRLSSKFPPIIDKPITSAVRRVVVVSAIQSVNTVVSDSSNTYALIWCYDQEVENAI